MIAVMDDFTGYALIAATVGWFIWTMFWICWWYKHDDWPPCPQDEGA